MAYKMILFDLLFLMLVPVIFSSYLVQSRIFFNIKVCKRGKS